MPRTAGLATITSILLAILFALVATLLLTQRPAPSPKTVAIEIKHFELVDTDGTVVTPESFAGKWALLFFGFTRCPDVCPTALIDMGQLLERLGPQAENLQPVFISVDPEWDTRERMADYMENFDPRIVGLTGTMDQIREVAKNYSVFFRKVRLEEDGYTIDHSAALYLLNPEGIYVRPYSWQDGPETLTTKLTVVMNGE
jgi:protein SCO1/2